MQSSRPSPVKCWGISFKMNTINVNDKNIQSTGTTYTITIDPTPQYTKPPADDYSIGIISNNIQLVTGLTVNGIATCFAKGYTWFPGTLNGSICNANWKSQSLFPLDFDKGLISVEDAIKRLNERELFPQIWYTTLSSREELHKFRILLIVDQPVEVLIHRDIIVDGLLALFPEADTSCRNAGRFYFGGKDSYILNQQPIPTQMLLDILCIEIISKDKGRSRYIPDTLFDSSNQSGQKSTSLYYNNRNSQISPDSTNISTTSPKGGALEVINWKLAQQRVKILDSFLKGEWLHHKQLFGLATNLIYIKGGRKLFKQTMEKFNKKGMTHYTQNNFNIHTYLNKVSYHPQLIYSFSTHKDDEDLYDLISATKNQRGFIEQTEPIVKMSLGEAEATFKSSFDDVINDSTNDKINLFILPTAIGKTEYITSTTATIAAPTNKLKDEIAQRMKVEYVTTPETVVFENEQLNRKLQYYYSIGLPHKATGVLYDVINEKNVLSYSSVDIEKASSYLAQLEKSHHSTQTVLTTHVRALHSNFTHDTIIFDEDPLKSLIDVKELKITDLIKLDYNTKILTNELDDLIKHLESSTPGEIKSTPQLNIDIDALMEKVTLSNIETNLFDFFNSSFYKRDSWNRDLIYYVVKRQLPKNKKIIILSATIPIYIYQKLYGDRLNIVDIRDVQQQGKIIQYTNKSCSRKSLSRYIDSVSKEVGDKPVITYKTFGNQFQNPVKEMYFGNCSGYDSMKGKDLVVVGTPHRNNIEYLLTAKILGIEFKTTEMGMSFKKIEYNGFKFMFNCYDNAELRSIQLALIESDLIQAIGRARTLRTDATVEVYSNFPLRMSDQFIY